MLKVEDFNSDSGTRRGRRLRRGVLKVGESSDRVERRDGNRKRAPLGDGEVVRHLLAEATTDDVCLLDLDRLGKDL